MRKYNFKGQCVKIKSSKGKEVCKLYDKIAVAYLEELEQNKEIIEIQTNVRLIGETSGDYCTDFVCMKRNNELMVRECVFKTHLSKPLTIERLDISKDYWNSRGVIDWGLVINEE